MSEPLSTNVERVKDIDTLARIIGQSNRPRIAMLSHAWGGGVERHVRDLIELVRPHYDVLILRGFLNGGVDVVFHGATETSPAIRVGGFGGDSLGQWLDAIRALSISRLHIHHLHGWPIEVLRFVADLGVPIDVTLHDFFYPCPQYHFSDEDNRYCGQPDVSGCSACVQKRPHGWGLSIDAWRAEMAKLLSHADRIFAPTRDTAERTRAYFPKITPRVLAHPELAIPIPRVCKVVILGGLSAIKGFALVCETVKLARAERRELSFRLIGHASDSLPEGITPTGTYDDADLPRLIAEERPDVIWFPAQVPETFSYTLSVACSTGLPIVASDFASFRERLANYPAARFVDSRANAQHWLEALQAAKPGQIVDQSSAASVQKSSDPSDYLAMYSEPLQSSAKHGDGKASNATALVSLLSVAQAPPPLPEYAIESLFRIGRYGGHRTSLDAVGLHLAALPAGERQIIGRSVYDQINASFAPLQAAYSQLRAEFDEQHRTLDSLYLQRASMAESHAAEVRDFQTRANNAVRHISYLESELRRITQSRSWRFTRPLRFAVRVARIVPRVLKTLIRLLTTDRAVLSRTFTVFRREGVRGTLSRLRREIRKTTRPDEGVFAAVDTEIAPAMEPLSFAQSETPKLSIVIPVYEHHPTTFACLKSLATHFPSIETEIIVADDASPTPASDALAMVSGVRFVRHPENLGFIRNVNAAVTHARGEFVLILNNDTLLTSGAIDALWQTFGEHDSVGMVGAKLLNADGSLQEAGGIVWQDGSAWNYGRGSHPLDPRFNYVRDVDYCSGAALLLRKQTFDELSGFDEHYLPAYYEDTDLAFRIRARGLRVLYQPHAAIYHIEGVSHGKDTERGVKSYQVVNEKKFRERWSSSLTSHRANGIEPARESHRSRKKTILIVEACMITPDQDSGSVRLLNLMRLLRAEGHHVVFLAENLEGTAQYRYPLEALGVEVLFEAWAGSVRSTLKERGREFDVVMLCRYYVAAAHIYEVRHYAPQARVVFDTVDLHFLREEREAKLRNDETALGEAAKTRATELSVINNSDATIVVSDVEKSLLSALAPDARIFIASNVHQLERNRPGFERRSGALFVGGFRHPPNIDAVLWYAEEVLPHVLEIDPNLVTTIVGSNMPERVASLNRPGLKVLGHVPDLRPILQSARVSIAPLRYGAGVKGKVNEAMNFGIPVVATATAVEGMHVAHGKECLIADDPREFANAIAELHRDAALWQRLSDAGAASVADHFSFDAVRASFLDALSLASDRNT